MSLESILPVSREMREDLLSQRSHVFWLTGLSGSGKTTLARLLEARLYELGYKTMILDGDAVRAGLCSDLGFAPEARKENIRRVAEVNKLMLDAGLIIINAFVSPYQADRNAVRSLLPEGSFSELYIKADLETCEQRDVKGWYAKARNGELTDFTGISAPYEAPIHPELVIATDHQTVEQSLEILCEYVFRVIK